MLACESQRTGSKKPQTERESRRLSKIYALPNTVLHPKNNPPTESKITLGRLLFFDPLLSGDRDVACATCHHPNSGFAESRDLSIGANGVGFGSTRRFREPNEIPFVKRNAHSIINTAFNGIDIRRHYDPSEAPMFWDMRANSLEQQALMPLKALEEMRGTRYSEREIVSEVVDRLRYNANYRALFAEAFPNLDEPIDSINLAKALASYERSIIGTGSRFDAFKRGEQNAMSQAEKAGMELFIEVGCAACHNGPMFSDYKTHILGVPENTKLHDIDRGFEESFGFRTATLRNLRFTFPFMHNGVFKSGREVLEFYQDISQGKSRNANIPVDSIDPLARSLKLQAKDFGPIENFLLSLNDDSFDREIPRSVPSGLEVGGKITTL